jgi:group I intron endonuclease
MSCGIYYLSINNKFYIGQSDRYRASRFSNHLSELRNNHHHSQKLQNAFNKYGEKNLTKGIIEECDIKDLDEKEKFYIR